MLALRRLRCLSHSVPTCQTRLLRTQPRPIPSDFRQWDPSRHEPRRLTKVSRTATGPRKQVESKAPIELSRPTDSQESDGLSQRNEPHEADASHDNHEEAHDLLRDGGEQHNTRGTEHIVIRYPHGNLKVRRDLIRLQHLLNVANVTNVFTQTLREPLWTAYEVCRRRIRHLPALLSRRAWDLLWKSQYMDFSDMPNRQSRLIQFHSDLVGAKRFELDLAGQAAFRLERKFMAGLQQKALEMWKSYRHQYPEAPEFLDTGARLYALGGFPDRAREIMDRLLELEPDWHVSAMLVVFRAYTSSQTEQHLEEARHMYKAIKAKTGDKGSIKIYDNCLLGFLEARSLADARRVFRDMVEAGHLDYDGSDSQIREVLRRLNRMYTLAIGISSMSSIALDAIAVLPVAYHGHLFSDWMRHALCQESPRVTAQILDMMIERGYQPESGHFEFLLQALFRTKDPDNVLKAESLGWKMVEEARLLSMPTDWRASETRLTAIKEKLASASVLDTDSAIRMPAANTSMFALLMRHHAERSQWEHVDFLTRQLKEANVAPDCNIMNAIIDNKIRQGQFVEAWQIYRTLTGDKIHEGSVFPDGATIRRLWTILRLAFNDPANLESPGLPTPREVLHETLEWWQLVRRRYDADRFRRGLLGLRENNAHRLILHCFGRVQDLAGALVALHVLRLDFNVHPTREDAKTFCLQMAWVPMHDQTDSARIKFSLSNNNARNTERLSRMYERVRTRRLSELHTDPSVELPLTEADAGDLELDAISELVRTVMLADRPPEAVELAIQVARQAIGVPNMPTGDATAFDLDEGSW